MSKELDYLDNPKSPDNLEVRKALVKRMNDGEITLAEAQKQLRKLIRKREAMYRAGDL